MRKIIESFIADNSLFDRGEQVVVGVSGGADSVALVYILHFLQKRFGIGLLLAHLHHAIRGPAADQDLRSVELLAARLGLSLFSARCDIPRLARERGISIEMAARAERLRFFSGLVTDIGADKVALGHNADDQAETVLLRLARGAGRSGLSGIVPLQSIDGLTIVHPMLTVSHTQAVEFLVTHGLRWREDASNASCDYYRNRIRHQVLPLLEENLNPNIRATLCRTAEIIGAEDRLLDSYASQALAAARIDDTGDLDLKCLCRQPQPLRRRALLAWLYAGGVPSESVDFEAIAAIERLIADLRGSSSVDIGSGYCVMRAYSRLSIGRRCIQNEPTRAYSLTVPGETQCSELGLVVLVERERGIVREDGTRPGRHPSAASISETKLGSRCLVLRTWRLGDRMCPYGMEGSRKLQDIFTDYKVPAAERAAIPVVECAGEIVWLPGFRISARWAVEDSSETNLKISISRRASL